MNKFSYKSCGHEIVDSGTIYLFKRDGDIEYNMDIVVIKEPEIRFKLKIIFNFADDGKEAYINRKVEKETVYFECYNFNSSLGVGTSEPVELGSVANRKLYMHLWVYAPGNETRKIEYTLYLESASE